MADRAALFAALHRPGDPLVLFNVWDAGSAWIVAAAGARAIATGSWGVAAAYGFEDGERMPLELALDNLRRIAAAVPLPVTADLEGGYDDPAATVSAALAAGAVGCNLEDGLVGTTGLRSIDDQCERLIAVRKAAGAPFFVNARTDLFLRSEPVAHGGLVRAALDRAFAFAEAGADGLFVPGLAHEDLIRAVCAKSPLPVNIMISAATPPARRLAQLGVARISHGAGPYRIAMGALAEAARAAHKPG